MIENQQTNLKFNFMTFESLPNYDPDQNYLKLKNVCCRKLQIKFDQTLYGDPISYQRFLNGFELLMAFKTFVWLIEQCDL